MKKYCMFLCVVMIVDVEPVDASAMNVVDIVSEHTMTIVSHNYQAVASELSTPQNTYALNDLLSIGEIGSRVIKFLDENTDTTMPEKSGKPSFVIDQQEDFMNSVRNSNFTQFSDAWTMLDFYRSNFPQLQKYSKFYTSQKQTPLHIAIASHLKYNNKDLQRMHDNAKTLILRRLLQKNSHIDIHARDDKEAAAMHYAAERRMLSAIKMLKKAGANVNVQDKKGNYPLHYVMNQTGFESDKVKTIEALVFLGAYINAKNNEMYRVRGQELIGMTPLEYAERMNTELLVIHTLKNLGGKK